MPPVRLITSSSEPIDHALWNELFAELDRKLTVLMDDKTWVLCQDIQVLGFMGRVFHFGNGLRPQSAFLQGVLYDHSRFTRVAEEAEIEAFDLEAHVVATKDAIATAEKTAIGLTSADEFFFDSSLEAHRRIFAPDEETPALLWWLLERPGAGFNTRLIPQKVYRFALAELVIEGEGLQTVRFESEWNKFNCFRVHNCNRYTVTVDFAGQFQLEVPRYACRTVRRIPIGTVNPPQSYVWEQGFNYFLKFRAGDPRLYSIDHDPRTPFGSQGANNITSPALVIHRVLEAFSGDYGLGGSPDIGGPKWLRDPFVLPDVSELYPGFFPASSR